ncbi:hypothetical protein LX32DRAFT_731014 [Colletotrichum zoysiae]|uniref:Uncharacterized protein n=1 Tax=Colletotrichum zoysiae TaxID=1216348 RepID=A0AAD9HBV7_9PEZI|nr:hypothetical protein LX32DRAFT_731014 [Colletotrichum zoysiae]
MKRLVSFTHIFGARIRDQGDFHSANHTMHLSSRTTGMRKPMSLACWTRQIDRNCWEFRNVISSIVLHLVVGLRPQSNY